MCSTLPGVLPEGFWSPFGPLIHKSRDRRTRFLHGRPSARAPGDQGGPWKTVLGRDEAQARNLLSPGLFCRADRI